jgi:hypothetical protein
MSDFDGPRIGWDEHAQGTVHVEIDLELWSNSGRSKHVDIDEQGAWLAEAIRQALRGLEHSDDIKIHRLRYFGQRQKIKDSPMSELQIDAESSEDV